MGAHNLAGVLLLVVGAILIYFGWDSSQPWGADFAQTVTEGFSEGTMWFFIGGALAIISGLCTAFMRR